MNSSTGKIPVDYPLTVCGAKRALAQQFYNNDFYEIMIGYIMKFG
jgi:hypothetical protein